MILIPTALFIFGVIFLIRNEIAFRILNRVIDNLFLETAELDDDSWSEIHSTINTIPNTQVKMIFCFWKSPKSILPESLKPFLDK